MKLLIKQLFASLMLLAIFAGCSGQKVVDYDEEILETFLSGIDSDDPLVAIIEQEVAGFVPRPSNLILGRQALSLFRHIRKNSRSDLLPLARAYVNFILEDKSISSNAGNLISIYDYDYNFSYGIAPAGWRSCMDQASLGLALLAASQELGSDELLEKAHSFMRGMTQDANAGGTMWRFGSADCWFSEYAWDGMTEKDELYVLNGFLFSLEALKIFAEITQEEEYEDFYACAYQGLTARSDLFRYKNEPWLYYALQPSMIDMDLPHYVIYEMLQFRALFALTDEPFFADEENYRSYILKENYPIYLYNEPSGSNLFFSRIGPPHPYLTDIYTNTIQCYDQEGVEIFKWDGTKSPAPNFLEIYFVNQRFPSSKARCRLFSNITDRRRLLYETELEALPNVKDFGVHATLHSFEIEPLLDAHFAGDGDSIVIDPLLTDYTRARIIINPETSIRRSATKYFGVLLNSPVDVPIGIIIADVEGKTAFRYYQPLKGGFDNFLLVNWLGFERLENLTDTIDQIWIDLYTDTSNFPYDPATIEIKDVFIFENDFQLFEFFRNNSDIYFAHRS